ncbi:hypothetical protein [Symbiopectobacterium purcellii]|uniref:Uncharacterized protein n=1 Tax=Symbiopectobacterium purcellii TaxID=2871826 RepID=A0ABX9ARG2_9ENTR|nr:hypothetical protein [Symbiopectobacterium purcellii]QZN97628.1 hypothetical protein K6K13_10080 [Symbiopectobacterium purcellii]
MKPLQEPAVLKKAVFEKNKGNLTIAFINKTPTRSKLTLHHKEMKW